MLPAQVSYWTLKENERHNRETERLTQMDIDERKRHNIQDEYVRVGTLDENRRNNLYVNRQGDVSLGLNAIDTETRSRQADTARFAAVSQAAIGQTQAYAALEQADAAQRNSRTNQITGVASALLNRTRSKQEALTGTVQRSLMRSQRDNYRADAAKTSKETEYVDFYAGDRAKQTDIQQQRAINEVGKSILDNITPW